MKASRSDRFAAFGAATKGALRRAVAALEIVPVVRVVAVVVTSLTLFPTRPVLAQSDLSGSGKGFVSTVAQGDLFMNLGYDARGNLAKEESSQGVSRLVEYDEWDRVVRETSGIVSAGPLDPAPVVVEYGYDAAGRLAFEKRNQTQAAGGGSGIGTQVREVVTRYTYDERGQLLTMTEEGLAGPSGGVSDTGTTTFSYQPGTGHLDTVTSPAGVVTKYRYDAAGRLAGERTEAPGVSPSPGESLRGYDILSRVNYQTDGDTAPGKVGEWKGIYDGFSRLVRQTLPTGAILEADYDQADGITEVRAKDAAGVLLSRISGVKLTTTGEVVDLSEHQGTGTPRRVQKTLDAAGRTTHVLNDGRVEREYEFQPATGRLLVEKTPTREQRYTYDGGSLWAKSVAAGEAQTGPSCSAFLPSTTTEIRRDAQGRPVAETKSDGKSTTYLWDEEGRPLLTREGSEAHFLTWDSRGALARLNRPNGRGETTFGYDLDGRPIRQVHTVPGLLAPEVTSAGIDAAGRRASLNLPDGGTELYRYDSDGELSEVTRPDGVKVGIERDRANRITRILPT
ncbi:MAG: RHS repeat protein, partial [Acidobacteria bacterium]|nr:RHS repeat protein [Acidobacteriota bacterium]